MKDSIKKSLLAISKALTGDEYKLGTDEYNQIYEVLTSLLEEQKEAVMKGLEGLKQPLDENSRYGATRNSTLEAALTFVREQV